MVKVSGEFLSADNMPNLFRLKTDYQDDSIIADGLELS